MSEKMQLVTIIICAVSILINLVVLSLNIKFFTEFVKERLQARRHEKKES